MRGLPWGPPWGLSWGPPWGLLAGPYGAVAAALAVAACGSLARRRWAACALAVGPLAVLAGWAVLMPRVGGWMRAGGVAEHLLVPAAVAVGVGVVRGTVGGRAGRWLGVAGLGVGAWWLAGMAGGEFWRVLIGGVAVGAVLARFEGHAAAGGLALCGGLAVGGAAPVWAGIAAVLAAGCVGGGSAGLVGMGGLLGLTVVAAELGARRIMSGQVGGVELACAAAVVAPVLAAWLERKVTMWPKRRWLARGVAVVGAGCAGVALAWVGNRVLRH